MELNRFVGIKILRHAEPTTKIKYNTFRGWKMPADEDPNEEGYLVVYEDSKNNTDKYEGYVSWSPKPVFDAAYLPVSQECTLGQAEFTNMLKTFLHTLPSEPK